jgi:hypothetical protein
MYPAMVFFAIYESYIKELQGEYVYYEITTQFISYIPLLLHQLLSGHCIINKSQ